VTWDKAHERLGWQPAVTLADGLKQTYDWLVEEAA
jgi:nucleoside-diphosphate-sugar epimerase